MKKIILVLICFLIVVGCKKKEAVDDSSSQELVKDKYIGDYKYERTLKCDAFNKEIKYYFGDSLITVDNEVYGISNYLYSNDTNCIKSESIEVTFVAKSLNDNVSIFEKDGTGYTIISLQDNAYLEKYDFIDNVILTLIENDYIRADYVPIANYSKDFTLQAIKNDNNIYETHMVCKVDTCVIEEERVIFSVDIDEVIIDFNFIKDLEMPYETTSDNFGESLFIQTNKNYYVITKAQSKCLDYSIEEYNAKCINENGESTFMYFFTKVDALSEYASSLVYIDKDILITKTGELYTK